MVFWKDFLKASGLTEADLDAKTKLRIKDANEIEKLISIDKLIKDKDLSKNAKFVMINDDIVNGITDIITDREEEKNIPPVVVAPVVAPVVEVVEKDKSEQESLFTEEQKTALKIENDLSEMFATGKTDWDLDSIASASKSIYNILFDTYNEGEENGVVTNKFSLIEANPNTKIFTLNKK